MSSKLSTIGQQAKTLSQLTSLDLVRDIFLTHAGALIADNNFISYSKVHATRWNDNDKTSLNIL
ncbi:hypothetical protein [Mycoplasma putrefaciens]|uniref:hypothetical protein n=1 Tax=Mycoplasma putrefaciens TaxID=2123 RepID=UPI0002F0D495|nr:hypothetical protein [Mycoplasma putrefaciens]